MLYHEVDRYCIWLIGSLFMIARRLTILQCLDIQSFAHIVIMPFCFVLWLKLYDRKPKVDSRLFSFRYRIYRFFGRFDIFMHFLLGLAILVEAKIDTTSPGLRLH